MMRKPITGKAFQWPCAIRVPRHEAEADDGEHFVHQGPPANHRAGAEVADLAAQVIRLGNLPTALQHRCKSVSTSETLAERENGGAADGALAMLPCFFSQQRAAFAK
jgi:hypothetical protein